MAELPSLSTDARGHAGAFRALVVCVCVSALVMTVYSQEGDDGPVHALRAGVQYVSSPLRDLGSVVERPFDAMRRAFVDGSADEETLTDLRNRNAALVAQLSEMQTYKQENDELRSMLGLASSVGASGVAAQVTAGSADSWTHTLTINRGSDDGVALDMAVIDGSALVGQVCSVAPTSAVVRLVGDASFSMSVSVGTEGATGVLTGSVGSTVRVEYVGVDCPVAVGDVVSASGVSDVYPKGLVVGTVSSVSTEPAALYHQIVVEPLAQASNASEVFVITSFGEQAAQGAFDAAQTGEAQ